ncbi:MAG: hypothetical protein GX684_01990 [Ruminococcaceae bacterium]|nr:hypothetical protein [Oscillospiraceae bacterium]
MNFKKLIALLLAVVMILALAACGTKPTTGGGGTETKAPTTEVDLGKKTMSLAELKDKEYGKDYTALYEKFGKQVTIKDVEEDAETGLAYVVIEGKKYELGMDFLSMAMVYNCQVPEDSSFKSADDVYAAWWKLYIQRWNYLMPEVPLYSNEYYDVYNAQIKGVAENPTNPFWPADKALIAWESEKADKDIILGSSTDLGGKFRYASFGATNPGASDLAIQELTSGLETVATTKEGGFAWNDTVVEKHEEKENEDGSKTFTITLHKDLKFSDGSPITAKNYLVSTLVFSSPVAAQAAERDHKSGLNLVGFKDHNTFTGKEGSEGTAEFAGLRLIDEYTFSATVDAEHLPYFYDISYGGFSPYDLKLWIGDNDIKDDGKGAYITEGFYAMDGDKYTMAKHISESALNTDGKYPYSGAFVIASYDKTDKSIILKKNENFKGNYEGLIPKIEKVTYKKIVAETQLDDLKAGGVDVLTGITGGAPTDEAITMADKSEGKFAYIHYSRAGYGKLSFRADYGPVQFPEVRRAIAYCMDRALFAKDFTGGYGGVVDGPFYTGSWMYKAAVAQGLSVNAYPTSTDSAIKELVDGGWVFDKDGKDYVSGVRYKKIAAAEATENDINFRSKDGAYTTTKVGEDYYMPLALNWYGTTPNEFTDLLVTGFMENENCKTAGFVIQSQTGDFQPMLDELYQAAIYGYYSGTPMYTCFNFATGFTSAAYDYAYNWTVDPGMYDDYSINYVKDLADIFWLA